MSEMFVTAQDLAFCCICVKECHSVQIRKGSTDGLQSGQTVSTHAEPFVCLLQTCSLAINIAQTSKQDAGNTNLRAASVAAVNTSFYDLEVVL